MAEQSVDELAVLRQTNAELVAKVQSRTARITELEATNATLQTSLTTAQSSLHEIQVGVPLRQMAESVSPVPELWLSEFGKHFKVELKDGKLSLLTVAGEPAIAKDGTPLEFTSAALTSLLTKSGNAAYRAFDTIMVASKASGGGANGNLVGNGRPNAESTSTVSAKPQFGLR
jgi:hypothetical protein